MELSNLEIIKSSEFFYPEFYLDNYKDLKYADIDPYVHFFNHGHKEGRLTYPVTTNNMHNFINNCVKNGENYILKLNQLKLEKPIQYEKFRIQKNIDVKNYNIIKNSQLFDDEYYKSQDADLNNLAIEPAYHYLISGQYEGRRCSVDFQHVWQNVKPSKTGDSLIAWERYGKQISKTEKDENHSVLMAESEKNCHIPILAVKSIIDNPDIEIVSFDIFDTLLCRPMIKPSDMFELIAIDLASKGINDFYKMRTSIEVDSCDWLANLDEIYEYMRKIYNIPFKIAQEMKDAELEAEKNLLLRREEIYKVYEYAVKKGKKIIAISDMYLPSSFLNEVLENNGYNIESIYVSNECFCWKYNGNLYDYVLEKENIKSDKILHIGDNIISDYYQPIQKNILAFYYPKARDFIINNTIIGRYYKDSDNLFSRIITGYIFNIISADFNQKEHKNNYFATWEEMAHLGVVPLLLAIALYILNNKDIQYGYTKVWFASRDGWQPKIAYDILSAITGGLPSEYIYAGRRAYNYLNCESFYDHILACKDAMTGVGEDDNFENILKLAITDAQVLAKILADLQPGEQVALPSLEKLFKLLKPYEADLNEHFQNKKLNAFKYYYSKTGPASREVVFDCGFSGSISKYIGPAINKYLDKIYLYSFPPNDEQDRKNGTITYNIIPDEQRPYGALHLAYEELFSPLEGGCLGFEDNNAILENIEFDESMRLKYRKLAEIIKSDIQFFSSRLKKYLKFFVNINIGDLLFLNMAMQNDKNNLWLKHFEDIKFPDPVGNCALNSLADKLSAKLDYRHPFNGTGFNYLNYLDTNDSTSSYNGKIGIHLHVYHYFILQETLAQLIYFPFPFDLHVTYSGENPRFLDKIFQSGAIKNLSNADFIQVANRGRDVAPWVLGMRGIQNKYDLFCHIHTKISDFTSWGTVWRHHLYGYLLGKDTARQIVASFEKDAGLGCVFPPPIKELSDYWIQHNLNPYGNFGEKTMMRNLLSRMGIDSQCVRKELVYSIGTMMWYRPEAMRQLFNFPLRVEEFRQEPAGIGGTIAHAIERLPAYICAFNGYKCAIINSRQNKDMEDA